MKKSEYIEFHKKFCERMIEVTRKKNSDYTGTNPDPFANFKNVENLDICEAETGFMVRMTDKFSRMISFIQKGVFEVKDESIEDTCIDLANYACLFLGYVVSKKSGIDVPESNSNTEVRIERINNKADIG